MARVKLSSTVSGMAGKLNGSAFVNTHYGLVLGNKATQRKNPYALQLPRRSIFKNLAYIWRTLSDLQRAENEANALNYPLTNTMGETYYLSGYALLLRSNLNLTMVSLPLLEVVPAIPPANVVGSYASTAFFIGGLGRRFARLLGWSVSSYTAGDTVMYYISAVQSAGVAVYNGNYLLVNTLPANTLTVGYTTLPNAVTANWQSGLRVFFRVVIISGNAGVEIGRVEGSAVIT